jgi:hypothetical protein
MERIPLLERMILRYQCNHFRTCPRFAGDAGMQATKTELIRLARLVQRDIAGDHVSKNVRQAIEVLSDYQNAAVELLELALEEATKEDKSLFDSFGFLFGQSLEALRFDIEAGYRTASDIADCARKRLVTASKAGAVGPSHLLVLIQCFGSAKLDPGAALRVIVERLLEEAGNIDADNFDPPDITDLFGLVADLVKQTDGDPFALHSVLGESAEGMPDEYRGVLAATFLFSSEPAAAEASIGWLLDQAAAVRQALANALEDAARKEKITPTMLRRMIAMRNWLPQDNRAALDASIATARRKGVQPALWDEVEVRQVVCTGVDGSGALGILAHCRSKRKNILGSLVLKLGIGIRDAWAQEGVKTKEIEHAFFEASLMDQFAVPAEFIRIAAGHFLALGQQTGSLPPFGLLRFLEALGISSVQPQFMSTSSLLEEIPDGRAITGNLFEKLLAAGSDLAGDYAFLESWFEVGDEVDAALSGSRTTRKKREAFIMEKVVEPRREQWAQSAAWTAYILNLAGNDERWQEFYATTLAIVQGRPLREIPLLKLVAEQTVMASESRQIAA